MGKDKKRKHADVEELLSRPWCYYCERDFDDLKILINHQKAKHFKCDKCGRRLNTAGGLSVHMTQVHKESLTSIENALPNRSGLEVEIFGTEGIPPEIIESHNTRVLTQYAQAEAERRAQTGNPAPGSAAGGTAKKPKFESPSDLKKRLAEHKARKAAEQAAGVGSGDATPVEPVRNQSPAFGQPLGYTGSPSYQQQFSAPPTGAGYPPYQQPYGQQQGQFSPPGGQPFSQQSPAFSPPPQQYGNPVFSPPGPQFQAPVNQGFPSGPYQNGGPQFPGGQPHAFGANSPPAPHQGQYRPPPRINTPPQVSGNAPAQRSNSLPNAPGLPVRPSFGAPPVNAMQMQQMHQGQLSGQPTVPLYNQNQRPNGSGSTTPQPPLPAVEPTSAATTGGAEPTEEKKNKKSKDKDDGKTKMIYADDEVSPEEKMAKMARYAFSPDNKDETVLSGTEAQVTGVASGYDDPARNTD